MLCEDFSVEWYEMGCIGHYNIEGMGLTNLLGFIPFYCRGYLDEGMLQEHNYKHFSHITVIYNIEKNIIANQRCFQHIGK